MEDDDLVVIQYRLLKVLFACVSCCSKLGRNGSTELCQGPVRITDLKKSKDDKTTVRGTQFGLARVLHVQCVKNPANHPDNTVWTSDKISVVEPWSQYIVNVQFILSCILLGLKYTGVQKFAALMFNISFDSQVYRKTKDRAHIVMRELAKDSMVRARQLLPCRDITASFDGTWSKRYGYNSLFGAVTCMSPQAEKIIGLSVLCRYCKVCKPHTNDGIPLECEQHGCQANHFNCDSHNGKATSMEKAGALSIARDLFADAGNFRVLNFVGDGDSSAYTEVRNCMAPEYGDAFTVTKLEDKNHAGKRLKGQIEKMHKTWKKKDAENDQLCSRLTVQKMARLCQAVTTNLNKNVTSSSTVADVKNNIWAVFYHYMSTNEIPLHKEACPPGPESWCPYMRALHDGLEAAHDHTTAMNKAGLQAVRPAFEYMTKNDSFLQALCHDFNTNANEAFHSLLWNITAKNRMTSFKSLQFSADLAVCYYNDGMEFTLKKLYSRMGVVLPREALLYSQNYDNRRETQKQKEKEAEEERATQAKEKANKRRAEEMEARMAYCAERAVAVEALEQAILTEGPAPLEPNQENISIETAVVRPMKRKYTRSAEKVPPTKRRTRKSGPDEDYEAGCGQL